ncbi:hypothetical protein LY90DRAFT_673810 [Neocallimastix californiae]|uniref:G-protein coupled receptors family 1 profile domain-containing protein n=1 Tax=Neocallimastix californiae TaxID=1754190 RepID=A0A1Y2B8I6_9FUNG|nr:hypothetical protein LY90DRAFT_673810 [Neocallimastix californiae]|eukprot:ORY30415.1 hypothetical protein LY90DRAFT_673810 [Neocallimastix californiae]
MVVNNISKTKEFIALFEHIVSFICTWLTMYLNNNSNIQFLALMNMWQHFIKILRIMIYGFQLENAPNWFCIFHSFMNYFSNNCVLLLSCYIIYNLYAAMKHPLYYAKYHIIIRPYVFLFITIYIGIFILASLYEPIFTPYSQTEISQRHNCSSAYRYRFYQYFLTSPLISLHFIILAIYCSIVIIHKIRTTPKSTITNEVIVRTKISLSKWIFILLICGGLALLSLFNLISDIYNGLHPENEREKLGILYYLTATSGIIIFFISVSPTKLKNFFGMKNLSDHRFEYGGVEVNNEIESNIKMIFEIDPSTMNFNFPRELEEVDELSFDDISSSSLLNPNINKMVFPEQLKSNYNYHNQTFDFPTSKNIHNTNLSNRNTLNNISNPNNYPTSFNYIHDTENRKYSNSISPNDYQIENPKIAHMNNTVHNNYF